MEVDVKKIDQFIEHYGNGKESLIQVMQDIQREYRYLPREALEYLSAKLNLPLSHTYNVATFYKTFSLQPKGEKHYCVCLGTACHVLGGEKILNFFCDQLGIEEGGTTEDGKFSVERVNCVGACALGPIVVQDEDYHRHMTIEKARKLLKGGE